MNRIPDEASRNSTNSTERVYRDGFGNPIINQEEIIRAKALKGLLAAFGVSQGSDSPRVSIEGNVRAGNVTYCSGATEISFWYEMGGGDCNLFIAVPSPDDWEDSTQTPLARREEILNFIAKTVQREKAPSWRYEIHDREIAFYNSP